MSGVGVAPDEYQVPLSPNVDSVDTVVSDSAEPETTAPIEPAHLVVASMAAMVIELRKRATSHGR